jgi:hypothetical protein
MGFDNGNCDYHIVSRGKNIVIVSSYFAVITPHLHDVRIEIIFLKSGSFFQEINAWHET